MANWFKPAEETPNPDPANAASGTAAGAGTAPPDIAELIASTVRASFAESLKPLNERIDAIENNTRRPERTTAETTTQQEYTSVFDDENAAINQRLVPLFQRQLETEAKFALSEVKQEYVAQGYGDAWKEFEPAILQTLEGSPLVGPDNQPCRGNKTYIHNVVDMVFGRAARSAGLKFGGKDRGFFVESAGGSDGFGAGAAHDDGLTDGQRRVFSRMGVSKEDSKKALAKLKFVS